MTVFVYKKQNIAFEFWETSAGESNLSFLKFIVLITFLTVSIEVQKCTMALMSLTTVFI